MEYEHVVHEFQPVYDASSVILILGSLPSVKSRENRFYYGNPQNRFWSVITALVNRGLFREKHAELPETIPEKTRLLLANGIAVWDVIASCDIRGSSDASIRNVVPAELGRIFDAAPIRAVFANGTAAGRLYDRYIGPQYGRGILVLPSTSPANAAWREEALADAWEAKIRLQLSSNGQPSV